MNTITLFLSDGQVLRQEENKTIPALQRKYPVGAKIVGANKYANLTIEATTIETTIK